MKALRLHYPVHTLDGKELFAAGSMLSHEAFQAARLKYPPLPTSYSPLLQHDSLFNDLQDMMEQPPYSTIYGDTDDRGAVLALLGSSRVQPIVLESLDYFRRFDLITYRHALMVFALSFLLARHLAIPGRDLEQEILSAGPTHDLGKICVPLPILRKEAPLTVSERRHLEHHTVAGFALLVWHSGDEHAPAARIARDHHERSNSTGYPGGIKLSDILVEVIAACDIYDALVSPRPYRPASFDNRTALEELTELAGKHCLSGEIIQLLVALNRRDRPRVDTCTVSLERRGTPPAENNYGVTVADDAQSSTAQKSSSVSPL
jgi:HD-GYP domain-containing protein (c-di-GMP phosphodiesterase class II)